MVVIQALHDDFLEKLDEHEEVAEQLQDDYIMIRLWILQK
jgi:hypothetical protein